MAKPEMSKSEIRSILNKLGELDSIIELQKKSNDIIKANNELYKKHISAISSDLQYTWENFTKFSIEMQEVNHILIEKCIMANCINEQEDVELSEKITNAIDLFIETGERICDVNDSESTEVSDR